MHLVGRARRRARVPRRVRRPGGILAAVGARVSPASAKAPAIDTYTVSIEHPALTEPLVVGRIATRRGAAATDAAFAAHVDQAIATHTEQAPHGAPAGGSA